VRTALLDLAVVDDEDLVSLPDRAQAMRDHETRAPSIRRRIASWMCFSVRVSTLLVASSRDENSRVGENGSGNGKHLPLSMAEIAAAFGQDCVVTLWKSMDEGVGVCQPRRLGDLCVGCIEPSVADVLPHGAGEKVRILKHNTELSAKVVLGDIADISAVDQNASGIDLRRNASAG